MKRLQKTINKYGGIISNCYTKSTIVHGSYKSFYQNGTKEYEGQVINNQWNGLLKTFFKNQLHIVEIKKRSNRNGIGIIFSDDVGKVYMNSSFVHEMI